MAHAIASAAAARSENCPTPPRANSGGASLGGGRASGVHDGFCYRQLTERGGRSERAENPTDRRFSFRATIAIDMRTIILDERQAASIIMRGPYQVPTSPSKNHKQTLHIQLCRIIRHGNDGSLGSDS